MERSISRTICVLGVVAMMLWTLYGTPVQAASKQVVFSGPGVYSYASANPAHKAFGFWIWCEGESTNPYHGVCSGAMYFYGLPLTKHVAGGVTEVSEGIYQMTVVSTADDTIQSCTLKNATANHGPTNTVDVSCVAPAGGGSSTNAVVNVTGP
jgi:hypothetical protein